MRYTLLFVSITLAWHAPLAADDKPTRPRALLTHRPNQVLVVLIGGIDSDPTPAQIDGTARRQEGNSGLFQLARELRQEAVQPEYFNWNGTRAGQIKDKKPPRARGIADFVDEHLQQRPGDRVALVGNSWGGHTALEVLDDLRNRESPLAIHLTVFLDPSSTGRGPPQPKSLPMNANRAINFCTRNAFVWGRWNAGHRLEHIDLGDPELGFMRDGQPPYAAKFNPQAHIAAEWDPRIHAEIRDRVLELLPER